MSKQCRSETISVNGIDMYYETCGEGKPLLILHGFTGSGAGLAELFNDLAKSHQLIIPDLRGHGRSTNPSKQFTFRQVAQDIFSLIEHLQITNCSAIGFSGGALALLQMAFQNPDKITSMALISAAPYFPQQAREIMRQVTVASKTKEDWEMMRKIHFHGDEQIKTLWEQAHHFADSYDDMNFTSEMLAQITAKTLIIQGDRDPIYPIELTVEMYKSIPNAYLWILPNSGHGPITVDILPEFLTKFNELC